MKQKTKAVVERVTLAMLLAGVAALLNELAIALQERDSTLQHRSYYRHRDDDSGQS